MSRFFNSKSLTIMLIMAWEAFLFRDLGRLHEQISFWNGLMVFTYAFFLGYNIHHILSMVNI